ncbi:LGFP repeat protein [Psychromonas ingrahamii 37]|uniref:LGFP repeat protein n=1 Tax=Psychromonas ingrahamii (strain DSM 17664 / CCUG 51855 / 37) TaxID=357804 RepID=A1SVI8_PSYIN|nr:LGFP repeat-containing protein [Psychromonas ingrahamii]ABM03503.1 LGFP repeat protein [Psychromonas ingrahamii 37]
MITIRESQYVAPKNATLKQLADDIANQVRLGLDKVVLNHFDPTTFQMPTEQSFETILEPLFQRLSDEKKTAAHMLALPKINVFHKPQDRRLGYLTGIDFSSKVSIQNQVKALNRRENIGLSTDDLFNERANTFKGKLRTSSVDITKTPSKDMLKLRNKLEFEIKRKPRVFTNVISEKHKTLGGDTGLLGKQMAWHGWWARYEYGAIFWNEETVCEVHGAIWSKYYALGGPDSYLGLPKIDESITPDKIGRYNHFDRASIYWTPQSGAHEVAESILEKWKKLGSEKSFLGYPITDQLRAPDKIGLYNHFQHGSIYWSPKTGAHEVHGAIRSKWQELGWEQSSLGYPVSDEETLMDGKGKYNRFEGGEIHWYPHSGAYLANPDVSTLTLRCVKLHCIDETGKEWTGGEAGFDEIKMGGSLIEIGPAGENVYKFGLVDLEGGWDDNEWNNWTSPRGLVATPINSDNGWPKAFLATFVLIEVDSGDYSKILYGLMEKVRPIVKEALEKALPVGELAAGGPLGAAIGFVAAKLAAYILEQVFDWISGAWHDDPFKPGNMILELSGPGALFSGGMYDAPDTYWTSIGHDGKYEYWLDWTLS